MFLLYLQFLSIARDEKFHIRYYIEQNYLGEY